MLQLVSNVRRPGTARPAQIELCAALLSIAPGTTVPVWSATSFTPRAETWTLRSAVDHTGRTKECIPGSTDINQGAGGSTGRTPAMATHSVVREGAVTTILS